MPEAVTRIVPELVLMVLSPDAELVVLVVLEPAGVVPALVGVEVVLLPHAASATAAPAAARTVANHRLRIAIFSNRYGNPLRAYTEDHVALARNVQRFLTRISGHAGLGVSDRNALAQPGE